MLEKPGFCEWDVVREVAKHAHHIHARVGYAQGPQVPHPAAPEYRGALVSHQRYWEEIWAIQRDRGYAFTTMTPEFGPDGYLHSKPFTCEPVADLWAINSWMGKMNMRISMIGKGEWGDGVPQGAIETVRAIAANGGSSGRSLGTRRLSSRTACHRSTKFMIALLRNGPGHALRIVAPSIMPNPPIEREKGCSSFFLARHND